MYRVEISLPGRKGLSVQISLAHVWRATCPGFADPQAYSVILASENIQDMARKPLARLGVRVMRVEFLDDVYRAEPEATTRAVCRAAKDLKKPPIHRTRAP